MAALIPQPVVDSGQHPVAFAPVTSGDVFEIFGGRTNVLLISNDTGAEVTGSFIGADAPATHTCQGFGTQTTEPQDFTVADGVTVAFNLNTVSKLLSGVVTITGGDGAEAAQIVV